MITPPVPLNETARLQELLSCDILDTGKEADYDSLVELAAQICGCPVAAISFIASDRQWFKAEKNLGLNETPREVSFCGHTILHNEVMVIPDARKDERFFDNPLVTAEQNQVIFYAGAPITTSAGHNLGAICVIDNNPRASLNEEQKKALKNIARQIVLLLELRAKNKQISEQAAQLLAAEKKITQLTISEQEKEKVEIAAELHENLAQILAATNMYLEMAGKSQDMQEFFIDKSKENIRQVISEMRQLCQTIVPTTIPNENYIHILQQFVHNWQQTHSVKLTFTEGNQASFIEPSTGLVFFRILQKTLKLAEYCCAETARIHLQRNSGWSFQFSCDGNAIRNSGPEMNLLKSIAARAESLNGKLVVAWNKSAGISFEVIVPAFDKQKDSKVSGETLMLSMV